MLAAYMARQRLSGLLWPPDEDIGGQAAKSASYACTLMSMAHAKDTEMSNRSKVHVSAAFINGRGVRTGFAEHP